MNQRLATVFALLLIACGALFVAYAAFTMQPAPVELARPPAVAPSPSGEGGPGENRGEGLLPETSAASAETAESAAAASSVPSTAAAPVVAPIRRPPDSPDSTDRDAARRQAAIMWVLTALPLVFITFVLIVVLRRLRPPPMKQTGPSDTTDLWQEAGRRMK